jgi:hypothetical protein
MLHGCEIKKIDENALCGYLKIQKCELKSTICLKQNVTDCFEIVTFISVHFNQAICYHLSRLGKGRQGPGLYPALLPIGPPGDDILSGCGNPLPPSPPTLPPQYPAHRPPPQPSVINQ